MLEETPALHTLLDLALAEDVGPGDVTTEATVPADARAAGTLVCKQPAVVFGVRVFGEALRRVDDAVRVEIVVDDGGTATPGTVVARVQGPARALLTGERVALNLLQRLSGIATMARAMTSLIRDYPNVKLLDTRKTAPGMRLLEKAAVRAGGGTNHRMGLFDGVLIKDNHVAVAGGVPQAVAAARRHAHHLLRIQCEVTNTEQLKQALAAGVDAVLLDNMDNPAIAECVKIVRAGGRPVFVEASGGMTPDRLRLVAALGVDGISMGALTHSASAVDYSLELQAAGG